MFCVRLEIKVKQERPDLKLPSPAKVGREQWVSHCEVTLVPEAISGWGSPILTTDQLTTYTL